MTGRWLSAWGLAAVAFGGASLIVPLYVVELGGGAFVLGLLFASSSFVGVPGALALGNLADRTGKRRIFVLAAIAVTAATMAAIPLLDSILAVVLANALLWLGFAAATPVLTLLVVAGEPEPRWTALIARLNRYQGIGWSLGLAMGAIVITLGSRFADAITAQRAFFLACAASATLGFVLGLRTLPQDARPGDAPAPKRIRRRVRQAARFNVRGASFPFTPTRIDVRQLHPGAFVDRFTRQLATYFLAVLLVFTGFGVFFAPLPAYLAAVGYSSGEIFALYLVVNVGAAAFYGYAARLAELYDVAQIHIGGLVTRGVTFSLIAVAGAAFGETLLGLATVTLAFLVVGLTWAMIAVTAATFVTRLAPAVIRGEALGVYGALVAVGGGLGGLLGGAIAGFGYTIAFSAAGTLVVVGAAVVAVLPWESTPASVSETESAS